MSGVKWIRLDTGMLDHPKFLYLKEDGQHKAIIVHIAAMMYSAEHGLAGFIPRVVLPRLDACSSDAQILTDASLWMPAPGGWQIRSWDEFQLSGEDAVKRSEHARKAAKARWTRQNGEDPP